MDVVFIRTRLLAQALARIWAAVSGVLGPTTAPRLRQILTAWDDGEPGTLFLDMRELHFAEETPPHTVRALFAFPGERRFHLIGAPTALRAHLADDPRFTLHADLESAWDAWH